MKTAVSLPDELFADFSARMLELARRKAQRLGAWAAWSEADALELSGEFDGSADLVYTGKGAMPWVPDIECGMFDEVGTAYLDLFAAGGVTYRGLWFRGTSWYPRRCSSVSTPVEQSARTTCENAIHRTRRGSNDECGPTFSR